MTVKHLSGVPMMNIHCIWGLMLRSFCNSFMKFQDAETISKSEEYCLFN